MLNDSKTNNLVANMAQGLTDEQLQETYRFFSDPELQLIPANKLIFQESEKELKKRGFLNIH